MEVAGDNIQMIWIIPDDFKQRLDEQSLKSHQIMIDDFQKIPNF